MLQMYILTLIIWIMEIRHFIVHTDFDESYLTPRVLPSNYQWQIYHEILNLGYWRAAWVWITALLGVQDYKKAKFPCTLNILYKRTKTNTFYLRLFASTSQSFGFDTESETFQTQKNNIKLVNKQSGTIILHNGT